MLSKYLSLLFVIIGVAVCDNTTRPIDDYVSAEEKVYGWKYLKEATFKTPTWGSTIHVLNVTSLEWLDVTKAKGENGAIWSHMVYVAVPSKLTNSNVSLAYITGDNNGKPNDVHDWHDEDVIVIDEIAFNTESVAIAIK